MGSVLVVADAPLLNERLGFEEGIEPPVDEQLYAEPVNERLDPGVFPVTRARRLLVAAVHTSHADQVRGLLGL